MINRAARFVLFSFIISWTIWGVLGFLVHAGATQFGHVLCWALFILGGNGPLFAAMIEMKVFAGNQDYIEFTGQVFKFRVSPVWYLWICAVLLTLFAIPWIIYHFATETTIPLFSEGLYQLMILLPGSIFTGGLEEVGWRGVLLPALIRKLPPAAATLAVSIIWTFWHLPLWFVKGSPQQNIDFLFFLILGLCFSFLLTALYRGTNSIFLCVIFHSLVNTLPDVINMPVMSIYRDSLIMLGFSVAVFLVHEGFLWGHIRNFIVARNNFHRVPKFFTLGKLRHYYIHNGRRH